MDDQVTVSEFRKNTKAWLDQAAAGKGIYLRRDGDLFLIRKVAHIMTPLPANNFYVDPLTPAGEIDALSQAALDELDYRRAKAAQKKTLVERFANKMANEHEKQFDKVLVDNINEQNKKITGAAPLNDRNGGAIDPHFTKISDDPATLNEFEAAPAGLVKESDRIRNEIIPALEQHLKDELEYCQDLDTRAKIETRYAAEIAAAWGAYHQLRADNQ